MTREEFIKILKEKGYSYKIEGDKIAINHRMGVVLRGLKTIPPGVEFNNGGDVYLGSLETLPPGVEFSNIGSVGLDSLKKISDDVEFNNGVYVYLESLVGGSFEDWRGNIEGINNKKLLNLMIKKELFI